MAEYQTEHPQATNAEIVAHMNSIEAALHQEAANAVSKGTLDHRLYEVTQTYDGTTAHTYTYYLPVALTKIVMTGGDVIGYGAFQNVANLTEITLYSNLKEIHDYAFDGCKKLGAILIPSTITSVGNMHSRIIMP